MPTSRDPRRPRPGPACGPIAWEARPGAAKAPLGRSAGRYQRRQPERSVLYQLLSREWPAFARTLAERSEYGAGLPAHVQKEVLDYLDCGILAKGFSRVRCGDCGHEILVGFSCKKRGLCPSCTARRMSDTAAHLVDRVIPRIPMRQWVLTFPPRVRWHLAEDPRLCSEVLTRVVRELWNDQRRRARKQGVKLRLNRANANAAIAFVQRFNSALQLSLHFHVLVPDGLFVRWPGEPPEARPHFVRLEPPTDEGVAAVLRRILTRTMAWLKKRGRLEDLDEDLGDPLRAAHALAARSPVRSSPRAEDPLPPLCARIDGFSLHAGVAIYQDDRVGLERLCRYGARPALSVDRLKEREDGLVEYTMKRTFSDGTRVIVLTAEELLARICALIPPPRVNLTRYLGQFAPRPRGRSALTGQPSRPRGANKPPVEDPTTAPARPPAAARDDSTAPPSMPPATASVPPWAAPSAPSPADPGRPPRLPWSDLLKRVFSVDVRVCPECSGPMRVLAYLTDPEVVRKVLTHLGLPAEPPPRGGARRPPPSPALGGRGPPRAPPVQLPLADPPCLA